MGGGERERGDCPLEREAGGDAEVGEGGEEVMVGLVEGVELGHAVGLSVVVHGPEVDLGRR